MPVKIHVMTPFFISWKKSAVVNKKVLAVRTCLHYAGLTYRLYKLKLRAPRFRGPRAPCKKEKIEEKKKRKNIIEKNVRTIIKISNR